MSEQAIVLCLFLYLVAVAVCLYLLLRKSTMRCPYELVRTAETLLKPRLDYSDVNSVVRHVAFKELKDVYWMYYSGWLTKQMLLSLAFLVLGSVGSYFSYSYGMPVLQKVGIDLRQETLLTFPLILGAAFASATFIKTLFSLADAKRIALRRMESAVDEHVSRAFQKRYGEVS